MLFPCMDSLKLAVSQSPLLASPHACLRLQLLHAPLRQMTPRSRLFTLHEESTSTAELGPRLPLEVTARRRVRWRLEHARNLSSKNLGVPHLESKDLRWRQLAGKREANLSTWLLKTPSRAIGVRTQCRVQPPLLLYCTPYIYRSTEKKQRWSPQSRRKELCLVVIVNAFWISSFFRSRPLYNTHANALGGSSMGAIVSKAHPVSHTSTCPCSVDPPLRVCWDAMSLCAGGEAHLVELLSRALVHILALRECVWSYRCWGQYNIRHRYSPTVKWY